MAGSVDLQRASSLVGQQVYVKTTTSAGDTKYVQGKVDYVVYENGKAYLSINESLYSLEDLDTVADKDYLDAYDKATEFVTQLRKLRGVNRIDMTDAESIEELQKTYEEMNEYEKSFVASEVVAELNAYINRLEEVKKAAGMETKEE